MNVIENNRRVHPRLTHRAQIKLTITSSSETHILSMRDYSESGLYLLSSNAAPPLGTLVEIQTTEIEDAPVQIASVMRIEDGIGFGVKFIDAAD